METILFSLFYPIGEDDIEVILLILSMTGLLVLTSKCFLTDLASSVKKDVNIDMLESSENVFYITKMIYYLVMVFLKSLRGMMKKSLSMKEILNLLLSILVMNFSE